MAIAAPTGATGAIVLADGTILWGRGFGAAGAGVGEVCFNTAMTGYQEVMTDPSYAGQIVTFTFPHIGNVGASSEDVEADKPHAVGCIVREAVTAPSNFRSAGRFDDWMAANGLIGVSGVDTRALTRRIREAGAPNAVIAHAPDGKFDVDELLAQARAWPGLEGMDLARVVSRMERAEWEAGVWSLGAGYAASSPLPSKGGAGGGCVSDDAALDDSTHPNPSLGREGLKRPHVVAIDYGAKHNIFRNLVRAGARVTVVAADSSAEDILALAPDGIFLSNGPGDPAATGDYAVPVLRALMAAGVTDFRDLPGASVAGAGGRRADGEDASGASRRQSSGQAAERRRGRDHQHEPRFCCGRGEPARRRGGHACVAVRRIELRFRNAGEAGVQRAISPRSEPGAAGQFLSVRAVCGGIAVSARLPPRPDFDQESERYFLATFHRARQDQHHIVDMSRWRLDLKNDPDELMKSWEHRGLGRMIQSDDGYTQTVSFSISEAGVAHALKLSRINERNKISARIRRGFLPALNTIATLVAALAALAAAYFSYLSLSDK